MADIYVKAVRAGHRAYKLGLSPMIGQACRFLPTCSDYTAEALITHGPLKGGWMGFKRICRCRPGGGSGYDPVPLKREK
ncbi:membrane protein insertion efficiency factor YidD [Asticcacaulis machinosus]|uniref:Putative membrane protein insertion efficiency factor n=1 Tax=Asticcacaulis machinosus TaxID=2984211 RepID=A0ABT5HMW2_9CAUL|nr:membrane protein insertion efficiency factor YidD [Asticcacaulis machinosus]MDC7677586.1 membrane protein insertion efficiency factor YidD [Asticcacaulis machinosus]